MDPDSAHGQLPEVNPEIFINLRGLQFRHRIKVLTGEGCRPQYGPHRARLATGVHHGPAKLEPAAQVHLGLPQSHRPVNLLRKAARKTYSPNNAAKQKPRSQRTMAKHSLGDLRTQAQRRSVVEANMRSRRHMRDAFKDIRGGEAQSGTA